MKEINVAENHIQIGAAATVSDAMKTLSEYYPTLEELFRRYGSVQIRNLATIGGNVANGSPIGDSLPALIALDAKLIITSLTGSRTVPAEDFFIDYGKQDLQPGEFLERVDVPLPAANQKFMIYKLSKRFHQDISAVCGAFSITKESNSNYRIRVCYGGMAATPLRARNCENALMSNGPASTDSVHKAKQALKLDFSPITDFRGSSDYRSLARWQSGSALRKRMDERTGDECVGREDMGDQAHEVSAALAVHLPVAHDSAERHVSGEALYVDDIPELRNLLYVWVALSTHASARILSMDTRAVESSPGVVAVLNSDSVVGKNDCSPTNGDDPVFAQDRVDFMGQVLFAVAAESRIASSRCVQ